MGNSTSKSSRSNSSSGKHRSKYHKQDLSARAQEVVGDSVRELQAGLQQSIQKLEEHDHPAAQLLDQLCSPYLDGESEGRKKRSSANKHQRGRRNRRSSYEDDEDDDEYSRSYDDEEEEDEDESEEESDYDESQTQMSDEETTETEYDRRRRRHQNKRNRKKTNSKKKTAPSTTKEDASYVSTEGYDSSIVEGGRGSSNRHRSSSRHRHDDDDTAGNTTAYTTGDEETLEATEFSEFPSKHNPPSTPQMQPLASSFAKRCYFTKSGIGGQTQHYEGLTLTGNVVLMLASAMKLKGCPTICDEDLRRVEHDYPNQFSRLPDELLLSSGWRRISKFCHFSNKAIPDGVPFFHSKKRLHPNGGYYFLLAAAVGMVRPIDVEPLTRDTLVLLETDYPTQCDAAPRELIEDPNQWTLVEKFCFFSGGPINTEEDVYYQADFDGNWIYMLAFLSPSLTPQELYKLDVEHDDAGLTTVAEVEQVEAVYDLTERDFEDLRLYHLGPCRALPQYLLQPQAWTKVLPPHFLSARERALRRAEEYEQRYAPPQYEQEEEYDDQGVYDDQQHPAEPHQHYGPHDRSMEVSGDSNDVYQDARNGEYSYENDMGHNDHTYGYPQEEQHAHQQEDMYMDDEPDHVRHHHSHHHAQEDQHHHHFDESNIPIDEAIAAHAAQAHRQPQKRLDPPDDEPPSLSNSPADPQPPQQFGSNPYFPDNFGQGAPEEYYDETGNRVVGADGFYADIPPQDEGYYDDMSPQNDDDGFLPVQSHDHQHRTVQGFSHAEKPPVSPHSPNGESVFSHQSNAMRGAQEMLRRNRQRKATAFSSVEAGKGSSSGLVMLPSLPKNPDPATMATSSNITDSESGTTWESGSDFSGSQWTDDSQSNLTGEQRNSRRALILQMAKARMKTTKNQGEEKKMDGGHLDDVVEHEDLHHDEYDPHQHLHPHHAFHDDEEEEEHLDLTGDLD